MRAARDFLGEIDVEAAQRRVGRLLAVDVENGDDGAEQLARPVAHRRADDAHPGEAPVAALVVHLRFRPLLAAVDHARERVFVRLELPAVGVIADPFGIGRGVARIEHGMTENLLRAAVAGDDAARGVGDDDADRRARQHRVEPSLGRRLQILRAPPLALGEDARDRVAQHAGERQIVLAEGVGLRRGELEHADGLAPAQDRRDQQRAGVDRPRRLLVHPRIDEGVGADHRLFLVHASARQARRARDLAPQKRLKPAADGDIDAGAALDDLDRSPIRRRHGRDRARGDGGQPLAEGVALARGVQSDTRQDADEIAAFARVLKV